MVTWWMYSIFFKKVHRVGIEIYSYAFDHVFGCGDEQVANLFNSDIVLKSHVVMTVYDKSFHKNLIYARE